MPAHSKLLEFKVVAQRVENKEEQYHGKRDPCGWSRRKPHRAQEECTYQPSSV